MTDFRNKTGSRTFAASQSTWPRFSRLRFSSLILPLPLLRRSVGLLLITACPLLLLSLCGCGSGGTKETSADRLRVARLNVAAGDFDAAAENASSIGETDPHWLEAQLVIGDALMRQEKFADALSHWNTLLTKPVAQDAERVYTFAGQCSREQGLLEQAEQHFRAALRRDPDDETALANLAFLLGGSGRVWEAGDVYRRLLKLGAADFSSLVLLADLERPIELHEFFEALADKADSDTVVARGLAAHAFRDGRAAEAEQRLSRIVDDHPEFIASQAMLGELLAAGPVEPFRKWYQALPPTAWNHPTIWYVCGLVARTHQDLPTATGCFRQAAKLAPTYRRAFNALGQTLYAQQHPAAKDVGNYARVVVSVGAFVDDVLRAKTAARFRAVVEALITTGRYWEACAWAAEASEEFPDSDWPVEVLRDHSDRLRQQQAVVAARLPEYCRQNQPPPDLAAFFRKLSDTAVAAADRTPSVPQSAIHFQADVVTLPFEYQNGHDPDTPGARFFEQTGGGVTVIDVDADCRPDLFFAQGGHFDTASRTFDRSTQELDGLFRNRRGQFNAVRAVALPPDRGFGQGASAGDWNNDGFQDLYVGNYEQNQLLINMGDGTFREATFDTQPAETHWTASTAIVDLNQDSNPDLVDINYLQGSELLTAICDGKACSPASFNPAPDVFLVNNGDDSFESIAGPENSKGLGCVIWQNEVDRSMQMFVSNDQVANVCLKFEQASDGTLTFSDLAVPIGLAFDEDGNRMGCMGIAAADFSGNGLVDLFVTNFQNEANTLYVQDAPGLFLDQTKASGLFPLSYQMVGWGTQALDADRDGHMDLVATNGHVDDHRDQGKGYHMPPQFFRNRGNAHFVELNAAAAGDFFAEKYLGRGLARLDWNRDAADDFVVCNIRRPATIATNQTQAPGHYLNVLLSGRSVARDAIGSVVELHTATGTHRRQLTGGDGFMASNERRLQFGLGSQTQLRQLKVRWPDGSQTVLDRPSIDSTVLAVQGQKVFELPPEE